MGEQENGAAEQPDQLGEPMYLWLKNAHVVLAYATVAGFAVRGIWAVMGSPLREQRWVRIAPHVVDTLLLALGVTLAIMLSVSPLEHAWLNAKVIGLLAYIGFGVMTMRAFTQPAKLVGFGCALACVGYIFVVALSKQAWPF
jgi:uncharacterized membrane protein SirB2